jgi:hypothetical protein
MDFIIKITIGLFLFSLLLLFFKTTKKMSKNYLERPLQELHNIKEKRIVNNQYINENLINMSEDDLRQIDLDNVEWKL